MARPEDWAKLRESFAQGGGEFFFPKQGRTKVRLVVPEGRDELHFYTQVTNSYGRVRFLVLGYIFDDETAAEERIRPIILPKTMMDFLFTQLAEGFDLFGPKGHGITIIRQGQGQFNTSYQGSVSAKPQALPKGVLWPEDSVDELAAKFNQNAEQRAATRSGGPSRGPTAEASWEAAGEEEDDEDDQGWIEEEYDDDDDDDFDEDDLEEPEPEPQKTRQARKKTAQQKTAARKPPRKRKKADF